MHGRTVVAGALAGLAALSTPSTAGPWAGELRTVSASAWVQGSDGLAYRLDVEGQLTGTSPAAVNDLRVDVFRCERKRCVEIGHHIKQVTAAELSIDSEIAVARVEALFGGQRLVVTWTAADTMLEAQQKRFHGGQANIGGHTGSDVALAEFWRHDHSTSLTLGTLRCPAAVSEGHQLFGADPVGRDAELRSPMPKALPRGLLADGRRTALRRCARVARAVSARRTIAAAVLATVAALTSGAQAEPWAGIQQERGVRLRITGTDGASYVVGITATYDMLAASKLRLDISRCDRYGFCEYVGRYLKPLTDEEFQTEGDDHANLETFIGRTRLVVQWLPVEGEDPGAGSYRADLGDSHDPTAASVYIQGPGAPQVANVSFAAVTCIQVKATSESRFGASTIDADHGITRTPPPAELPRGLFAAGNRRPGCRANMA